MAPEEGAGLSAPKGSSARPKGGSGCPQLKATTPVIVPGSVTIGSTILKAADAPLIHEDAVDSLCVYTNRCLKGRHQHMFVFEKVIATSTTPNSVKGPP